MNYSLRQLLLVSLLSASMLIWGIAAYISYKGIRDEVAGLFDAELAQSAKVLHALVESLVREGALSKHWAQAQTDDLLRSYSLGRKSQRKGAFQQWAKEAELLQRAESEPSIPVSGLSKTNIDEELWRDAFEGLLDANSLGHKYERKIAFQLWSKTDGLLLRSDSAPTFAFASIDHGFSETNIDHTLWHVYSISSSNDEYVIHVGQQEQIRGELTDEISTQLIKQFLIGLPFLGVVIWLIVGQALKPLNRLERSLSKREASYLKPLSSKKLPKEIVPVVNEINNLFAQLEQAFEDERRFTADASHELRTPLAGLLTQAQVAMRTQDEVVRNQALKRIEQAVKRMSYMVQQLLTFSRIDSNTEFLAKDVTLLSSEVVQVITELDPEAHKKRILIEFEEDNVAPIIANTLLINILIRNIIDNAIKYTPAYGTIKVSVTGNNEQVGFCVEDSGPGIPPEQYEQSLKRFHRCVETANKAQGTGLGFSIVERIVGIHGAELTLGESEFGGLKVTVIFPLPKRAVVKKRLGSLSFFTIRKSGEENS
ncbi:MAG: ATP-binding protein [Methylococcaceae bacterium]|nr:ATP-binding protein [Methylococcaceae bacterium]